LAVREATYYRVTIPSNTPSWKVKLSAESGEVMLLAQKGALPNVAAGRGQGQWWGLSLGGTVATGFHGGKRMEKAGNEHYVMLPEEGQTNLPAGDYYLAVASEGVNPGGNNIGSGTSDYVIESQGSLPVMDLGTVNVGSD